jgi:hypothetical protein
MNNFKFLSLIIVVVACYTQKIHTMELVNRDQKNDVAIEMRHVWSDDYTQNISAIHNLDLKSIRSSLKNEMYVLPHSDTLHHLLYLSTINKKNSTKTLFTQKQQDTFDAALRVKRAVPWWFGINGAVIAGTSLFPFINLSGLSQCSNATLTDCLSQTATILTPTGVVVAGALAVGFVSLYATGLSPDLSSRRADKVQDEIGHLNRHYATLAKYWIDIYFSCPEKAHYIADKFDIEELKLRAQLKTHKKRSGKSLVSSLEEAWRFIKHKTVSITFTETENYLYNKIHSQRIELLESELNLLKKTILEQNAEIENLKKEKI